MLGQVEAETGKRYLSLCTGEASGDTGRVQVFNSLSWEREEWISHEGNWCKAKVPPMGYAVIPLNAGNGNTAGEAAGAYSGGQLLSTGDVMENDIFSIVFSENGFIKSIYDKAEKRYIIPEGAVANGLALYEDKGDAWDFPVYYDEKPGELLKLIDSTVYTDGPQIIRESSFRTPSGQSILEQKVVLTLGKRQIDFITAVDWNENSKMLRTSFPVNVYAQEATCEIQFGNVKRPTHRNTSWDMAKYEVYAHKWVDISQGDYGVALLNDCKYGHKVLDNILDLNLLRSTSFPGTGADLGRQVFTYSLFPHKGDYIRGGVVKAGYELNVPLKTIPANPAVKSASLLTVEAGNIIVESVKKCEDSDDLIIRMYECHGTGISTKVDFGFKTRDIRLVDLMEKETDQESLDSDTGILTFKPFEIQTLKVSV